MDATGGFMKKTIAIGLECLVFTVLFALAFLGAPVFAGQDWILLKNAKVYAMGTGGVLEPGMILIKGAKIEKVGKDIDLPPGGQVMDLAGQTVIPGIVCASSSLFLGPNDRTFAGDETPDADILEGMNHFEDLIPDLLAQGVTTAYISPVSFQTVGGLGAVVKWTPQNRGEIEVLKDKAGLELKLEGVGKKDSSLARLMQYQRVRDLFRQALEYKEDWRKYEKKFAEYNGALKDEAVKDKPKEPEKPKKDEGKEILLLAMDKKIPVRIEAHRPDALLNALSLGDEFGLKILLEQGEDWPKVISRIQSSSAGLLSNPLLNYEKRLIPGGAQGYAGRLMNAREKDLFIAVKDREGEEISAESVKPWGDLAAAKIPLALVPPDMIPRSSRFMRFYASLLVAQGMSEMEALKSITSAPAELLGVSARVGTIENGKDADFVVLDGPPLNSLSKVIAVFMNGKKVWEKES
jgi:imidazolonepropionase-like amidohydrolase